MNRDPAAWLLRRHRDGAASDWRVEQRLAKEFNLLIEKRASLQPELEELRRSAPERLLSFDRATDLALQRKSERRFKEALQEIRRAAAELSELLPIVTAAAELADASRSIRDLQTLVGAELAAMTTLGILLRLQGLARQLLDQGETRKARFVVLLLRSQTERLQSKRSGELPVGLSRILTDAALGDKTGAVTVLRRLAGEGRIDLAERLAEDWDSTLSMQDRHRQAESAKISGWRDFTAIRRLAASTGRTLTSWLEGLDSEPFERRTS